MTYQIHLPKRIGKPSFETECGSLEEAKQLVESNKEWRFGRVVNVEPETDTMMLVAFFWHQRDPGTRAYRGLMWEPVHLPPNRELPVVVLDDPIRAW